MEKGELRVDEVILVRVEFRWSLPKRSRRSVSSIIQESEKVTIDSDKTDRTHAFFQRLSSFPHTIPFNIQNHLNLQIQQSLTPASRRRSDDNKRLCTQTHQSLTTSTA
jgi:hypothetical protein